LSNLRSIDDIPQEWIEELTNAVLESEVPPEVKEARKNEKWNEGYSRAKNKTTADSMKSKIPETAANIGKGVANDVKDAQETPLKDMFPATTHASPAMSYAAPAMTVGLEWHQLAQQRPPLSERLAELPIPDHWSEGIVAVVQTELRNNNERQQHTTAERTNITTVPTQDIVKGTYTLISHLVSWYAKIKTGMGDTAQEVLDSGVGLFNETLEYLQFMYDLNNIDLPSGLYDRIIERVHQNVRQRQNDQTQQNNAGPSSAS
jgi:hypothetical protein